MRAVHRIIATLLALIVLAAAVIFLVEVIAAALGNQPVWVDWTDVPNVLHRNTWSDIGPRVLAGVLGAVGLLLVLLALLRGKPAAIRLTPISDSVEAETTRKSLQRSLKAYALDVEGVASAKVKVKRHRVKVKIKTPLRDESDLADQIREKLQGRLDTLGVERQPRLAVKLTTREDA